MYKLFFQGELCVCKSYTNKQKRNFNKHSAKHMILHFLFVKNTKEQS